MGRFRIGASTGSKTQLLESKLADKPSQVIVQKADTSEIEKALENLQNKFLKMQEIPVATNSIETKTIVEKTETIKEIHSMKTMDHRSRKYAKALKRLIKIQSFRNDAQDARDESQDIQILKQKEAIQKLQNLIIELQHSHSIIESNILKEIQILKENKALKILSIGLIVSLILSMTALVLK
ncbi:MAG: hypothetical protein EBZ95_04865 [Chitinophagia bacterium]|nr:hypothetical protein [Chitinophagia bacterium]